MPKHPPKPSATEPTIVEHAPISDLRSFTAWHYFLARALEKTKSRGLEVHCFVRLGSLPLEADVIILRLDPDADTHSFAEHFGFLVPALRRYLIIEYKSPEDRLTRADFDTVRAYAMLCKRKYEVVEDSEIAVAMLYSRSEADFFSGCARSGYPFVQTQPGVSHSNQLPMSFYAVDLVAIGELQPDHPINLLSARRRDYRAAGLPSGLGPFAVLYEELFLREMKKMGQLQVPGYEEVLDDARRLRAVIIAQSSAAERLAGMEPEERLAGMEPEDLLRGLKPETISRLRELLLKQDPR